MRKILYLIGILVLQQTTNAQVFDPAKGCVIDPNGECVTNTVLTAMPFLRIAPDARGGAMGDVGIALNPDANSLHYNAANIVFSELESSASVTYTPWLRDLQLNDIFLAYMAANKKIDDDQALAFGLRWFSLGTINFTDNDGGEIGVGKPREFELSAAYARKLGDNLSASLTGKFLYSNLATGQFVNGLEINSATSFAADMAVAYKKKVKLSGYDAKLGLGMTVSNIGAKVSYTGNSIKDFLPGNLGLGSALTIDFDEYNQLTLALDVNKTLSPSPIAKMCLDENGNPIQCPGWDETGQPEIADYREKTLFDGVLGSFSDAQGGFKEEMQEINYSLGFEYWYDQQFAFRLGYYYEHPLKGARQYMTAGLGLKYNIFGIDISYLVPTSAIRSPLDNTLRFGLSFDLNRLGELDN